MHSLHIIVLIIGVFGSTSVVALYYLAQDRLATKNALFTLGFGGLLGLVAIGAIYSNYFTFAILFSSYVAYFVYLKNVIEFNLKTESTMGSLFMGVVIGFSGLLGCIVCHS